MKTGGRGIKERLVALAVCFLLSVASALPIAACAPKPPVWETQAELTDTGVKLTLTKVKGAQEYVIYHSPSRYGRYEQVSRQKGRTYEHEDAYGYFRVDAVAEGQVIHSELLSYETETFGENMYIYAPTDDLASVEEDFAAAYERTGQFSSARFAAFFKAGSYDGLQCTLRYYMTIGGLGKTSEDVAVDGLRVPAQLPNGNGTCNFWFAAENMTVRGDVLWAASQATSFRRMNVLGDMFLTEGKSNSWGSGGFIADSRVEGVIDAGVQQQWLTRNSDWGGWQGGDINLTFVGPSADSPVPAEGINGLESVTVEKTPVVQEKPFLVFDDGYYVCVPALRRNAVGPSADDQSLSNRYIPLQDFYVARSDRDTAKTLNAALAAGKHLFFTPGIYDIDAPLRVENAGTVILGCGLTTLRVAGGNRDTAMEVADADGILLGGLLFEAGTHSENLLRLGAGYTGISHADAPIACSDVFFRIGGARDAPTYVRQALVINACNVLGDNFWVWRGDHTDGVGWDVNVTQNGVVVDGDDVTVYGLMVEHFHEYQTIWKGENGFVAFYQSETPYEVPEQSAWMSEWRGTRYFGYASYKIADEVQKHTAYGIGVYFVSDGAVYVLDHAVEAPAAGQIALYHIALSVFSAPDGAGILHFVNDAGEGIVKPYPSGGQKKQMASYVAGVPSL